MRRAAGFTLIELLVAMALLALLSLLLVGGLHISRKAALRGESGSEAMLRADAAFGVIRRQLERAVPLLLADRGTEPAVAFVGGASSTVFIAPPGAFLAAGGEEVTWISIERGAKGIRVVLRYRPLDLGAEQWPPTLDGKGMQRVVLLDGLDHAQFSYFGRVPPHVDPQWRTDWDGQAGLPALIRLTLAGEGVEWPDLVVTPRLGRPASAGLLPPTPLCRRYGSSRC